MNKINGQSVDIKQEKINFLKQKFPEVFAEDSKIDFEKLKLAIGENIDVDSERYGLNWAGKTDCFYEIQNTTSKTLKPNKNESVDFDKTKNLFIEGDNLEALKILQKSYYGKIKMIYIDPPYNTGNDFVYNDKFNQERKEYEEEAGIKDEDGNKSIDSALQKNTKDSGHYHSNWLNMMYPRLFLARNLLKDDGVIFISIDDNELSNLKHVCDEIFGEQNFVSSIIRKRRASQANLSKDISPIHEYIIVYKKTDSANLNRIDSNIDETKYKNPDNDFRGSYVTMPCTNKGGTIYSINTPSGEAYNDEWRFKESTYKKLLNDNRIVFPSKGRGKPRYKLFLNEKKKMGQIANTWWDKVATNQIGTIELRKLFGDENLFDNPKPIGLIKKIIKLTCLKDDIILDFFAGSGTTAQAVMELNKEDGGNRKFILVQLPEKTDEDSEAYKAGYKNIADIAKERIRRSTKIIVSDAKQSQNKLSFEQSENSTSDHHSEQSEESKSLDLGFKVFKISPSNFHIWRKDIKTTEELKKQMQLSIDNVKNDSQKENILYELMLKVGVDPNADIKKIKSDNKTIYLINGNELAIYLEDDISQNEINTIISHKPAKIIMLDKTFSKNDQLKTNTLLQMEENKIDFKVI